MGRLTEILELAQGRAKEKGLPYDGALLPEEAHELLQLAPGAVVVDVRTRAEWEWVGRLPDSVEIEWLSWPGSQPNPGFAAELGRRVDREALAMFLCRSGARSHAAATLAKQLGYGGVYNILQGFEGDKDAHQHRNTVGGWRAAGLPWIQG